MISISKIKLLLVSLTAVSFMLISMPALAANVSDACDVGGARTSTYCKQNGTNPFVGPDGIITKGVRIIAVISCVAAVIMLIIGGYLYVTSGGDPSGIQTAKNTILYAVVGLIVVAAAQAIVTFVIGRL